MKYYHVLFLLLIGNVLCAMEKESIAEFNKINERQESVQWVFFNKFYSDIKDRI